jgi:hypothetical protein
MLNTPCTLCESWCSRRNGENYLIFSKKSMMRILCLGATIVSAATYAADKGSENPANRGDTVEYGAHPGTMADAIVVLEPLEDAQLHHASKVARTILGKILSNERDRVIEGSITHAPNTIISPLRKGEAVKLFLMRYENKNEYYIIGVFPADAPSGEKQ